MAAAPEPEPAKEKITQTEVITTTNSAGEEPVVQTVRGVPKSGRFWKTTQTRRNSHSHYKSSQAKRTWAQKVKQRQEVKRIKQEEEALRQETAAAKQAERGKFFVFFSHCLHIILYLVLKEKS